MRINEINLMNYFILSLLHETLNLLLFYIRLFKDVANIGLLLYIK